MTVYSKRQLLNRYIQEQAAMAQEHECISEATYKKILNDYPTGLYTPNYFIRIALSASTLVTIIFSTLLIELIFEFSMSAGSLLFFAVVSYGALELLVRKKGYYNAGVDNLLMCCSVVFMVSAFAERNYDYQEIVVSLLLMLSCLFLSIRFVDRFMALVSYIGLLLLIFLIYTKLGGIAKATVPFIMILVSASVYITATKLASLRKNLFYHNCMKTVMIAAMLSFYVAGNFYVVKELSNEMFGLHLDLHDTIPFGWLFWFLTVTIPVAYVGYGIVQKNIVFIRVGMIVATASIFTFRYYYSIAPIEFVMLVSGVVMIAVPYALTKYLNTARHGFIFKKAKPVGWQKTGLENLIVTQIAGGNKKVEEGVEFGQGSFGGAGSGGQF